VLFAAALPARGLEAGAAKVEITPAAGVPMNGYGARNGRDAIGTHDSLWARALYLYDGETSVFLVNTDLCLINAALRERVLEYAPKSVPQENIILTATHTHNAPGGMEPDFPIRFVSGRYLPDLLEHTARQIAKSMEEAFAAKQRAAIGYAAGEHGGLTANRRVDNGPTDKQLGVIRVDNADGVPIAIVANLAAHPTSVPDSDRYQFSADYPGYYYNALETASGEGCVALFLNGAQGDQTIRSPSGLEGWDRTKEVGELLASRVKKIADEIDCVEARLHVGHAQTALPPSIASLLPRTSTVLQTLEIDGLLLCFWPGEPCVELGLALRERAKAAGYAMQCTVALSNDYQMYFVPDHMYATVGYESSMNFFGPYSGEFLIEGFSRMMTRATEGGEPDSEVLPEEREVGGGRYLRLSGTGAERGFQQGRLFADELRARYDQRVTGPLSAGALLPTEGFWNSLPSFIDTTPLALTALASGARPRLAGVAGDTMRLMDGMARGAGLPFDAVWLMQSSGDFLRYEDRSVLFQGPLCTMFAVEGDRAAGGLTVGRNLDWPMAESPVISEVTAPDALRYVQVGFAWNAGVFTGMNERGVAVCLQRLETAAPGPWTETPIEFALVSVLREAKTLDDAVAMLRRVRASHGYVLVAGPTKEGGGAAVVEFQGEPSVRRAETGYLPGVRLDDGRIDADTRDRYTRAEVLFEGQELITAEMVRDALQDQLAGTAPGSILNAQTAHSVVFEPLRGRMQVAFPDAETGALAYETVQVFDPDAVVEPEEAVAR
jgi:hypothetical protein